VKDFIMSSEYMLDRPRRSFLKTGAATIALIGVGGWFASYLTDKGARAVLDKAVHLDPQAQAMLAKLADAVLDGLLPTDAAARARAIVQVVSTADKSLGELPPHLQKETKDLFGMLGAAPTRAMLIGQWGGWAGVSREDVSRMLTGLRSSSISLRRAIYLLMRDLVANSFYADPDTWKLVGYPGPLLRGPGVEV